MRFSILSLSSATWLAYSYIHWDPADSAPIESVSVPKEFADSVSPGNVESGERTLCVNRPAAVTLYLDLLRWGLVYVPILQGSIGQLFQRVQSRSIRPDGTVWRVKDAPGRQGPAL